MHIQYYAVTEMCTQILRYISDYGQEGKTGKNKGKAIPAAGCGGS
jgi:hypothetical protein